MRLTLFEKNGLSLAIRPESYIRDDREESIVRTTKTLNRHVVVVSTVRFETRYVWTDRDGIEIDF